jgi:fibronectin type 3 domain-containing protein
MWNPTTGALLDPNAGEVNMVPAVPNAGLPASWPTDGRDGGVPDPAAVGPSMIQIGTEGGFLPAPAVLPNTPVGYDYNRRSITVLNVLNKTLFLGPAERADVIVDFSAFAGKTIILYNDAPAPVPAFDPRYDYYTGDPDQTSTGGAPTTQPGYGPNTRTIMQIRVASATPVAYNPTPLNTALPAAFAASQPPPVVPQAAYNAAYNASYPADAYVRIQDTSLTFTPAGSTTPMTMQLQPKAIQELFDTDYGRMNATLGVELPYTNNQIQTTIPYGYIDPPTETIQDSVTPMSPVAGDGTQIWKITHNGVDTHAIHFHLFNVQLINRVGWDGMVKPPDPNEVGWKDTVRMNPLEDAIVALRPVAPKTPFGLPDSIRPLDVTMPIGSTVGFTNIDPNGNPITVINQLFNFGWEYVWHCHLLGHEENDMMRPMLFNVARLLPAAPILSYTRVGAPVNLTWTDATPPTPVNLGNPANEIGFRIQRATVGKGGSPGAYAQIGSALANATSYTDTTADTVSTYSYQVVAFNAAGSSTSAPVTVGPLAGPPAAPTGLAATLQSGPQVGLTWTDNATNETGFVVERAVGAGPFSTLATVGPRTNTGSVSYADATVTAGNTYAYRVKAVNGAGSSAYSNTASVSVPSPPAAPSGLTATLQPGPQVGLTWTDNATNETGFVVERAVGAGAFSTLATVGPRINTGSVSYVDTTVTTGNTYAYRVKAVNGAGSSAYSNTASVSLSSPLAAPSGLTARAARTTGLTDTVTLRWTDNANNETGFTIQRATNSTFTAGLNTSTVAANTTTTQQTGLARGRIYWYRIRAVNLVGASAWSNVVIVLTP